jgi:ribosomal protein S18 acetylase RimI-like enzyme
MDAWPTPEPARTEERAAAFRLLFQRQPPGDADRLLANALFLVQSGQLDPDGLFVLRGPEGVRAALLCLINPGASAALWPPQARPDAERRRDEDALLTHARAWAFARGAKLIQAQLTLEEKDEAAALERHGLRHITHLWQLRRDLRAAPAPPAGGPARLGYDPFRSENSDAFQRTLLRTYEGTLDCPEVNGVRTAEEILEGHRSQGVYDPDRWWLLRREGAPVGVALLIEHPEFDEWDLSYLGLVPEARGLGLGREAMIRALAEAQAAGRRGVCLSVDGRNRPAWGLYRGLGFEPIERREIYLALRR